VDEAHHLSSEILEEIRLLTNLETSQRKLLQIVLAGQPELDQKLDSHELRQLKQRIALRCHLAPLNPNETKAYISRRLKIAGALGAGEIFSGPAIDAVFHHSRGIPRLINTICENADGVDQPRNSPRMVEHGVDRRPGKNLARSQGAGNLEAAAYIRLGLVRIERGKMAAQRDPLLQLPQLMGIEFLIEFWLTRQHDLQQ